MKVIQGNSDHADFQAIISKHPVPGYIINAEDFPGRRPASRNRQRELFVGRFEGLEEYARRKSAACSAPLLTSGTEHQQPDTQTTRTTTIFNSPRLPADFPALNENDCAPFDCSIACGPSHLLTAAGNTCALFDKSGMLHWWCELNEWFAGVTENVSIYHPRVLYDQFSGRWVIAACARALKGRGSWLLLSVSQTRSPQGAWLTWAFEARAGDSHKNGFVAEGLGLGVDYDALYLTANLFDGQGKFQTTLLRIIGKPSLLTDVQPELCDFVNLKNPDGSLVFGLQPAHTFGTPGVEYLVNATSDGRSLTQWNLTHPLSPQPHLGHRTVPVFSYQPAPNARQPEGASEIETGDTRLTGLIFRHGHLWTAHTVAAYWGGEANHAAVQWFQINAGTRQIAQQGVYGNPDMHYFCPAMMVDGQSNLIMAFNRSGRDEPVSLRFTGRLSTDLPNLLHSSALLRQGIAPGIAEWGGYNGAAVDTNDMKVWVIGQYGAGGDECRTWIGETSYITSRAEGGAMGARRSMLAR